jgi:hypothetical protein
MPARPEYIGSVKSRMLTATQRRLHAANKAILTAWWFALRKSGISAHKSRNNLPLTTKVGRTVCERSFARIEPLPSVRHPMRHVGHGALYGLVCHGGWRLISTFSQHIYLHINHIMWSLTEYVIYNYWFGASSQWITQSYGFLLRFA